MHRRPLGFSLIIALAYALCFDLSAHGQSGRVRQLRQTEARASGLSGREVKTRTKVSPERWDETRAGEESGRTGSRRFDARGLNEGRRPPVAYSLDAEHITFAVIAVMLIVILTSRRV
jgi:hypothetical protein